MWFKSLLLTVFIRATFCAVPKELEVRYDDYKVYNVFVENQQQFNQLREFEENGKLNFWSELREIGGDCDVMVAPRAQKEFEDFLAKVQAKFAVKIKNVQSLIDSQKPTKRSTGLEWTQYHTLDEINTWVDQIASKYSSVVTPFTIGKSYEGRPIQGIKISHKAGNKAIFIESNIHAREWITSAAITYIINELLLSKNLTVRDMAENIDWYIIPVLNVDGFVFSHEKNRLWRKSRLPSDPTGKCIGTDLNRNFDFLWMYAGASADPCSETYAGPSAASDPEIQQLTKYINQSIPADTIKVYISLHSYGQYVLSPWGHTDEEMPDNYADMMTVAKGYADALEKRYGTLFTYGSSSTTLYKVSGSGKEWAYGIKNIPIPYTIELRDKGQYGHVLPPEYIIPVAKEVLDGFIGMVKAARDIKVL